MTFGLASCFTLSMLTDGLSRGARFILFLRINAKKVELAVQIRYGTPMQQKRIIDLANKHSPPFCLQLPHNNKFISIYRQTIVFRAQELQDPSRCDILFPQLQEWWMEFASKDMKEIERIFVAGLQRPIP